ncbi:MAG: stage II sporulation protein P [Sarcina sp.]
MTKTKNLDINIMTKAPIGMMMFFVITVFFSCRFVKLVFENEDIGLHPYVQILNMGMPIVETTTYDESIFENFESLNSVLRETFWLNNVTAQTIVGTQIPIFKDYDLLVQNEIKEQESDLDSFVLNEEQVIKEEEKPVNKEDSLNGIRNPQIVKKLDNSRPQVLIYHSHTDEGFNVPRDFTPDRTKNVVGVGELITKELEEYYGISVIHDKTKHDVSYLTAYNRSNETLQSYKGKYSDGFDMIIDLHRDGIIPKENPKSRNYYKDIVTTQINNESLAKLMFVHSTNTQYAQTSSSINQRMKQNADKLFPGLVREIKVFNKSRFNQEVMPNSVLIEVGAEVTHPEEAMNVAKYIARLIAEEVYYKDNLKKNN